MPTIPRPPLNAVSSKLIDSSAILNRGVDVPYPVYAFGDGKKNFWSNRQGDWYEDKPVEIVDGETVHLPDPALDSTISPPPAPANIGT